MAKGIDLSSLTRTERLVLASGWLLFASGLVPWWYRVPTGDGPVTYNAGLTGWGSIAVVSGAIAGVGVLARASIWPNPAPRVDGAAYTVLGALATAAIVIQFDRTRAEWIGLYVALVLALVLTVAGARRALERRAGWT